MIVKGKGFSKTFKAHEALGILLKKAKFSPISENIHVIDAVDRILAVNIHSKVNLPGFIRSAMDGYAVIAEDTHGASETNPIQLQITGNVEIGDIDTPSSNTGTAIKISTGAPLPEVANAVVKIEDCELIDENNLEVVKSVSKGKNVAKMDEDVKIGQLIFGKGLILKPWDIAMLVSIGNTEIEVLKRPKIATLSTGNELVSSNPQKGQVIDSNRPAINSWLEKLGAKIADTRHCDDDLDTIKATIIELANKSDLIISTGGTSVGTRDYLPEVIEELGELWVHGISIRPGKPVALGKIVLLERETPIIALPGYPLAAFINFNLFVTQLHAKWTKIAPPWQKTTKVKLLQRIPSKSGFRDFIRLKKSENGAKLIRITGAGILSSLIQADYLLEIPEDVEGYPAGEEVNVTILRE
ncbi:MAG: molybdopterin molybdotransferase MoeA [Candidatus Kariarchaeaceae archaeon]